MSHFTPAFFKFLKELKAHNNREWFSQNKDRYEEVVKGPALSFIADFASHLKKVSPNFTADPRPVGGSLFRIYKDTRFSKDKTPYKTHVGAHFPHKGCGKDVSALGFYLHLSPSDSFGGGGIWHPTSHSLLQIRNRIVDHGDEWKRFKKLKLEIHGDTLSRPPRGFDANHEFIADIKRKDFYVMHPFSDKEVCSNEFLERFVEACRESAPLVRFISSALDLRWN